MPLYSARIGKSHFAFEARCSQMGRRLTAIGAYSASQQRSPGRRQVATQ